MKNARHLVLLPLIALATSGCVGLHNRAVLQHACPDCRSGPFCAFERLEPEYCVLCQRPLDGRAEMTETDRYAELEAIAAALHQESNGILDRHPTAHEDRLAAQRIREHSLSLHRWISKDRGLQ